MPCDLNRITICAACEKELPVIAKLAETIWPMAYGNILEPGQIRYMLKMMYDTRVLRKEYAEGVRFDLIWDGGTPVGFASYGPAGPEAGVAKLHKLYLDFDYHGCGIGTLALRHVIQEARNAGYRLLRLNVNRSNKSALRAYERNGFHRAATVDVPIGEGFFMNDYVMELKLQEA